MEAAEELCAVADGGHVHDANNPGHNFEVMMGKVYKQSNLIRSICIVPDNCLERDEVPVQLHPFF